MFLILNSTFVAWTKNPAYLIQDGLFVTVALNRRTSLSVRLYALMTQVKLLVGKLPYLIQHRRKYTLHQKLNKVFLKKYLVVDKSNQEGEQNCKCQNDIKISASNFVRLQFFPIEFGLHWTPLLITGSLNFSIANGTKFHSASKCHL